MNLTNLEDYEEVGKIRINVVKRARTHTRSSNRFAVFDSSHNISQILKFLPFYERLGLRVVNSKWNLSFYFSECWESLDYRFFDLRKHEFYLSNFKRFIANIKKLDIRIDQICDLDKLICSSLFSDSKCVDSFSDPGPHFNPDCTIDDLDIVETDNELLSDADLPFLNSDLNDSVKHSSVRRNEDTFDHLKNILKTLKKLNSLHVSDVCNRNNDIFTRVNPAILKFIESQDFSDDSSNACLSDDLTLRRLLSGHHLLDNSSEPCGLSTLIIDCPVDVHFILQLVPLIKNVRNLIISRIHDDSSMCSVISELLEHIPPNQLLSLQVGRTIPKYSPKKVEFSTSASRRRINRLNFAYGAFGNTQLDEGDEIISILLSNHSDSLKILILDDIEFSLAAYRSIGNFKSLSYSKIYAWSNLSSLFSLDGF